MAVAPDSLVTQIGSTTGSLASLSLLEQSGTIDNPAAYVTFQPSGSVYSGYQTFHFAGDVTPSRISTMLLQVNFKASAAPAQNWSFSIYDWKTNLWINVGNTLGTTPGQWNTLTFSIKKFTRYISTGREVRIRFQSTNASDIAKLDYEALHITYRPVAIAPSPVVPAVPGQRPGIASIRIASDP